MNILNIFNKKEIKEEPKTGEIGDYGSMYYRGNIPRYNPDALLSRKGDNVYEKMMTDDQVKAVVRFKQYAIVARDYFFNIDGCSDDEEKEKQEEMARFFSAVISNINGQFTDKLIGILSALRDGFSITEKVYEPFEYQNKTMWGIKDLKLLPASSFNYGFESDAHGNITNVKQAISGNEIDIPYDKLLHFIYQPDIDIHYGESDLRACYRAWWSKDIVIRFQNIFLERHASGFIWAQVKGSLDNQQKINLRALLNNIQARMSAQLPESVELKNMQPMSTDAFEKAIAQYDKAISKSILVPNLMGITEQGTTGSYAQSQTQIEAFIWVLDQISNTLAELLNEGIFKDLAYWNFGSTVYPKFKWAPMSDTKKFDIVKTWGEFVSKGGATRTNDDENYFRKLLGVPERLEDEEPAPGIEPDIENEPEAAEFKKYTQNKWLKRVNFTAIENDMNKNELLMLDELLKEAVDIKLSIKKQIIKMAGDKSFGNINPKEAMEIVIKNAAVNRIKKISKQNLQVIMTDSYETAKKELPKKYSVSSSMDIKTVENYLLVEAAKISTDLSTSLTKAVQRVISTSIKYDKTLAQTIKAIEEDTVIAGILPQVIGPPNRAFNIPALLKTVVRTANSEAVNQARQAFFTSKENEGFVVAFQYSAVLDERVTDICQSLDGKIKKEWTSMTPPNHFNCRSILVPITIIDEWDGVESKINVKPNKGFY